MTIRSTDSNSQGFTLAEMLIVIAIVGILIGLAAPSLLTLYKPLREGTSQFKSQLNLIRAKAIASNQAYRIRPKYPTKAEYQRGIPRSFIVEYAANCSVTTIGAGPANVNNGWLRASQLDLDLSEEIGIDGTTTVSGAATGAGSDNYTLANSGSSYTITSEANLNWKVCYDNRGIANSSVILTFRDFQANNRSKSAKVNVLPIGAAQIDTYLTTDGSGTANNPTFF